MGSDLFIFVFLFFVLGTIVGSFLNVVVYRYNTGMTISGYSMCLSCGKRLRWYMLIPVVSYFAFHGKCGYCGSKVSPQYPAVEATTGIIFALLYVHSGFSIFTPYAQESLMLVFDLLIWSILVVIVTYDLRHKIIPDLFAFLFAAAALVKLLVLVGMTDLLRSPGVWDLAAGPILALPFAALWFFSRGRWMGFGDAKLAVGIGWFLGLLNGITGIIFGFWIGAAVGIILLFLKRKRFTMKSELPFAPFLVLGMLVAYLLPIDLLGLGLFLQ